MAACTLLYFILLTMHLCYSVGQKLTFPAVTDIFTDDFESTCNGTFTFNMQHSTEPIRNVIFDSPQLVCLNLSGNGMSSDSNILKGLPSLKYGNFANNAFNINDLLSSCHCNLEVLDANENSYADFEDQKIVLKGKFPKLRKLYLSGNYFSGITSKNPLPSLTHLDLSNSRISQDQFEWLPASLKYLNLEKNRLKSLSILNLLNLKWLSVSTDGIILSGVHFNNLPSLKYLSLASCGIEYTSTFSMLGLDSLVYLDLSKNNFRTFFNVEFLSSLPNLRFLNLSGNKNVNVGYFYSPNFHFTHIDLSGTHLSSHRWLPDSLEHAVARNSTFNLSVPDDLCDIWNFESNKSCSRFKFLDLSSNEIEHLTAKAFKNMGNLNFLDLSNNYIDTIDLGVFEDLSELRRLNLESNLIGDIPKVMKNLKLETLNLNCNALKTIKNSSFGPLRILKQLFLHGNSIASIEPRAFEGLKALETLTLSHNQISHLQKDWILPLENLKELDLSGNLFSNLNSLQLSSKASLKHLYLYNQFIELSGVRNLPENVTIYIAPGKHFVQACTMRIANE